MVIFFKIIVNNENIMLVFLCKNDKIKIDRVGDKNLEGRIVKWFKYFMFWNIWLECMF